VAPRNDPRSARPAAVNRAGHAAGSSRSRSNPAAQPRCALPVLDLLQEVQRQVNEYCIEIMTQAARTDRPGTLPLVNELRDVLLQMTPEMRVRAARRTFMLADMEFGNGEWWRCVKQYPGRPLPLAEARGNLPRSQAVQLARNALTLAWHAVRADRHAAGVLLGMSRAVRDIIGALSLADVERIVPSQFPHARPRWENRSDMWLKMLRAAQTPNIRRSRDVNLRGLQWMGGALVPRESVKAKLPRRDRRRGVSARLSQRQTNLMHVRLEPNREHRAPELACNACGGLAPSEVSQQPDIVTAPKKSLASTA
jgi:hypothetical protein